VERLCRHLPGEWCVSFRIYHREYPQRFRAAVLAIFLFSVLFGWLVAEINWESIADLAHPLSLVFAYFIALFTGEYVSGRLTDLRATGSETPLEQIEDPTTKPWRYTNHSFSQVRWSPDIGRDQRKEIEKFYRQQEPVLKRGIFKMWDRLLEETGTSNYRVFSILGPPRFIRIYKAADKSDLDCRSRIVAHFKRNRTFDRDLFRYLEPLPIRKPECDEDRELQKITLSESCFAPDRDVWMQMFPYLDIDTHYKGRDPIELESTAKVFGDLQAKLQSLKSDDLREIIKNPRRNPNVGRRRTGQKLTDDWDAIRNEAQRNKFQNPYSQILEDERELNSAEAGQLTQWINESASLRRNPSGGPDRPFLHDVHPHNVLCKDHECVLVYDYSWIGLWPHAWVLAFSLHRFVREYAIENAKMEILRHRHDGMHPPKVKKLVKQGTQLFLKAYCDAGGPALPPLPENFETNLGAYIRCSNMDKMLGAFQKGLGLSEEVLMRPEERQLGEARKFVRFMKESENFRDYYVWFWLTLPVQIG
jgi:hypothetical protein